jgi:hypothetical protein
MNGGRMALTLLISTLCFLSSCGKRGPIDNEVSIASPCVLVAQPSEHNGQKLRLTGYITSTKEGAYMWGDGCKASGVVLTFGKALVQDTKFKEALMKYGLSSSPIKATLLGEFHYERFKGVKTFDAEQVMDLQTSSTTEAVPPVDVNPHPDTLVHESGHAEPPKPQ